MPQNEMKAARFHAAKDVRIDEIPVPKVKPGWDGPHIIPQPGSPHVLTGEEPPVVLGHEFSGVIDEVGDGVTELKKGDRVCVQPIIYDEECKACQQGLPNCCAQFGFIGLSGWGRGMSEYTCAPVSAIRKLPDDFPLDLGALVEPLAVGWHAVETSPFQKDNSVLVLGGGPIGLAVVLALFGKGCQNIIVSEVSKRRREFATDFGAHHTIDPSKVDIVEAVKKFTNGDGVDVAFDAAGVQPAVDTAIKAVRPRGTLVNIALWGAKRVSLNMTDMLFGERRYLAVVTYTKGDFEAVIDAIHTARIKPKGMITKILGVDEVDEGFKALVKDKDNQCKILIHVGKLRS